MMTRTKFWYAMALSAALMLGTGAQAATQAGKADKPSKADKTDKADKADKGGKADKGVTVKVTDSGFEPAKITVKKDTPVHLVFLRTSETTCGTEVLIPDQHIQKSLPLNKPVAVDLTFKQAGEVVFTCGQKMLKGSIVVEQS